jgi:hypothetical protein
MNPIEAAVRPLKVDAVNRAEQEARAFADRIYFKLEAVGWDQNQYGGYPDSRMATIEYKSKLALYHVVCKITRWTEYSRRPSDPCIVERNDKGLEKFVQEIMDDAAAQYENYVAKLVAKIGECDTATLKGNHVWDESFLTVSKPTGTEVWKTQAIWNKSKFGLPFPQWPTRKLKKGQ